MGRLNVCTEKACMKNPNDGAMTMNKKRNEHSRYETARRILVFLTLFVGVGAVGGAAGMLYDITGAFMGMDEMLPYFQVLPLASVLFQDLLFSGMALLVVNGITNITAAVLLIKRREAGIICGGVFGITLMMWICIQFYILPANFMSTSFFMIGLAQALAGYAAWVFYKQENFHFNEADYHNIGNDGRRLVVYFSRMGYVRKLAYEEADRTGAMIYEIKPMERTGGTLGFWWCGRYGMHRWAMPVEPFAGRLDLDSFDHVTICTPIWVCSLAAPVKAFCRLASGHIKQTDYIVVHHTRGIDYRNAADEMDSLLGVCSEQLRSVCCRFGRYDKDCYYKAKDSI